MSEKYVKFGHYRGGNVSVPVKLAASQVFKARSGQFVYLDGSGNAVIADDGANEIFGHAQEAERTTSATAGAEEVKVNIDPSAVFRIPVGAGTYVATMRGKTCDLIVDASNIQGADLTAADDDVLVVVDGDLVNNEWVDVMINQKERCQSGVV